jgi:hypothetical protein
MASSKRPRDRPANGGTDNVYLAPRMEVGSSDRTIYLSGDGWRQLNEVGSPQKRVRVEQDYEYDLVEQWESADVWDPGCAEGGLGEDGCQEAISSVVINQVPDDKAKHYMNSVCVIFEGKYRIDLPQFLFLQDMPMFSWKEYTNEFLQVLLRHEGLPSATCATCHNAPIYPPGLMEATSRTHQPTGPYLIRCQDCHGGFVECVSCSTTRHANLPLHNLQVYFR